MFACNCMGISEELIRAYIHETFGERIVDIWATARTIRLKLIAQQVRDEHKKLHSGDFCDGCEFQVVMAIVKAIDEHNEMFRPAAYGHLNLKEAA